MLPAHPCAGTNARRPRRHPCLLVCAAARACRRGGVGSVPPAAYGSARGPERRPLGSPSHGLECRRIASSRGSSGTPKPVGMLDTPMGILVCCPRKTTAGPSFILFLAPRLAVPWRQPVRRKRRSVSPPPFLLRSPPNHIGPVIGPAFPGGIAARSIPRSNSACFGQWRCPAPPAPLVVARTRGAARLRRPDSFLLMALLGLWITCGIPVNEYLISAQ